MITSVSVGDLFPDTNHIGHHLPVGSVLTQSQSYHTKFIQKAPRTWVGDNCLIDPYTLISPLYLREVGNGSDTVELPAESAAAFRWRLRDTALAAAERSSVPSRPVIQLAESFGSLGPRFTVGGVVSNEVDLKTLPVGSTVYSGHPDAPDFLSVWDMTEQGLTHVFGREQQRQAAQPVTIYSMPGQSVDDEPPAERDVLARIAVRAYRLGKVSQRKNSWCSVFDNTLAALGINESLLVSIGESVRGPGDEVDKAHAALLPEGSMLWWQWQNRKAFAVYVRDDSARNTSKTRRLFGFDDDRDNSHDRMMVVQVPEEEMVWRVAGWVLSKMPDGVRFTDPARGDMVLDETWRNNTHAHYHHYMVQGWAA